MSLKLLLILSLSLTALSKIDYFKGGLDWPGQCHGGHNQSPIAIDYDTISNEPNKLNIETEYTNLQNPKINYVDDLNILQVPYLDGTLHFRDMAEQTHHYKTTMVEFHSPSEHTFDGIQADLEMQIIHEKKNSDQVAIVSILFSMIEDEVEYDFTRRNLQMYPTNRPGYGGPPPPQMMMPATEPFQGYQNSPNGYVPINPGTGFGSNWQNNLDYSQTQKVPPSQQQIVNGLFEGISFKNQQTTIQNLRLKKIMEHAGDFFFNYGGSMTTPPCEENVSWLVMAKLLPLKKSEFRQFFSISTEFGRGNNRMIQSDNNRLILLGNSGQTTFSNIDPQPNWTLISPTLAFLREED